MSSNNTVKVAINGCYGGFGLSREARVEFVVLKAIKDGKYTREQVEPIAKLIVKREDWKCKDKSLIDEKLKMLDQDIVVFLESLYKDANNIIYGEDEHLRSDPELIATIEALGSKANGTCAVIVIKEIPSEYKDCYTIKEYDGAECVICESSKLIAYKIKEFAPKFPTATMEEKDAILQEFINLATADRN